MSLALNEEQQLIKNAAHDFVATHFAVDQVRQFRDQNDPLRYNRETWREMAAMGWTGIIFPEAYGGLGLGYQELGIVLEELGRALVPQPFLSTVLLAGNILLSAGNESQKIRWLPAICAGESVLALAFQESGRFAPWRIDTRASASAGGFTVKGQKQFVLDACGADQLIVVARNDGAMDQPQGLSLFLVSPDSPGVEITPLSTVDARNAAIVEFNDVEVPASQLIGELNGAAEVLNQVFDRATAGLCAELLGTFSEAFERTLDYLKTRQQFGALIGSFQALKHRTADMFCEREHAISLTREALRAIDEQREDRALMTSAAKARVSDTANLIGRESVQMFGGIGMTDEEDIGLFMKRARAAELLLGDGLYHRERFASLSGF